MGTRFSRKNIWKIQPFPLLQMRWEGKRGKLLIRTEFSSPDRADSTYHMTTRQRRTVSTTNHSLTKWRRRGRTEEYYDKKFTEKKFWMWLGQVQIFLYLETWIVCISILVCNIHSQTENNGCKSNVQKWDPSERRKADPVFPAGTAGFRMDNGHFLVIWNFMEWFIGASTSLAHIYIV